MKILVTGGAGFIGSAVVRLAITNGHSVVNLAAVFSKHKPDVVMHLAAESHVDRSIDRPSEFVETNITGTFNILEASRKYWQKQGYPDKFRFHHISTDEVFGSLPRDPDTRFTEKTPYNPRSPYSASKASSDHLVRAWHETYGLPVILTNCSNNFGPYQFPEKLIPVVILNALSEKPLPIYGNGENIRDWLYVDDHASALLLVLEKGESMKPYNVGSGTGVEIGELLFAVLNASERNPLIKWDNSKPTTIPYKVSSIERLQNELDFKPDYTFEQGIKETMEWYENL